jgi:hypothetical protein
VPTHYAAEERVADILRRLGKPAAAQFVEGKLPTSKSIRSGDLGEILATEWIASRGDYHVPINRLRWKDHRNMAMRGDDVIGIHQDPQTNRLSFLKTEVKSRVTLGPAVVAEARASLDKNGGFSLCSCALLCRRPLAGGSPLGHPLRPNRRRFAADGHRPHQRSGADDPGRR